MNFCEKCDNLYGFITNEDDNDKRTMSLKCQACGNPSEIKQNMQIYAKQYISRTHDMQVDPDLQYDYTLTRTSLVKCLNEQCPTITENVRPEVATYQYNSETGKLGYICLVCKHYWKNL